MAWSCWQGGYEILCGVQKVNIRMVSNQKLPKTKEELTIVAICNRSQTTRGKFQNYRNRKFKTNDCWPNGWLHKGCRLEDGILLAIFRGT